MELKARNMKPHLYVPQYGDDETFCRENCDKPKDDPIHTNSTKHLPPVLAMASYLANELKQELLVGQHVRPGEDPELVWFVNTQDFELMAIHINPDGSFNHFEFTWQDSERVAGGYDPIPFLIATISWLTEGGEK